VWRPEQDSVDPVAGRRISTDSPRNPRRSHPQPRPGHRRRRHAPATATIGESRLGVCGTGVRKAHGRVAWDQHQELFCAHAAMSAFDRPATSALQRSRGLPVASAQADELQTSMMVVDRLGPAWTRLAVPTGCRARRFQNDGRCAGWPGCGTGALGPSSPWAAQTASAGFGRQYVGIKYCTKMPARRRW
jgi:hypothetical protein